jgi:flagellar protein FliO/FliZ
MYLNSFLALIFVLGIILFLAWLVKKFDIYNNQNNNDSKNRISILQSIRIDPKRRIMLIKRDGIEHLIMVGGQTDIVIEKNITPPEIENIKNEGSEHEKR